MSDLGGVGKLTGESDAHLRFVVVILVGLGVAGVQLGGQLLVRVGLDAERFGNAEDFEEVGECGEAGVVQELLQGDFVGMCGEACGSRRMNAHPQLCIGLCVVDGVASVEGVQAGDEAVPGRCKAPSVVLDGGLQLDEILG